VESVAARTTTEAGREHGAGPLRVVLVDDAVEIREMLGFVLSRKPDFSVVAEAADGAAGVQAVADHRPDLVLLDVSMPVMGGLEALRLIRRQWPEVVVVMFSAFGDANDVARESVRSGAHGYIRKGDTLTGLDDQLRALVAAARNQDVDPGEGPGSGPGPATPGSSTW
jgi:DNA-binding NarL/FixJ family response regulator